MQAFASDPRPSTSAGASSATPPSVFLRLPEVMRVTGLARSTVYRLMAEDGFPAPCRLGRRAVGWRSDDIARWSAARPRCRAGSGRRAAPCAP